MSPFRALRLTPWGLYWPVQTFGLPHLYEDVSLEAKISYPDHELRVLKIQYGSPGAGDLLGLGKIVEQVKDAIFKWVDRKDTKEQRALENDEQGLRNDGLRIKNAREFVALNKDLGLTEEQIRPLVAPLIAEVTSRQETAWRLIEEGKITSVEVLDVNETESNE